MISVLVPTRGRVARLETLLESFAQTSAGLAEIVCRCDDDDEPTRDFLRARKVTAICGPRGAGYWDLAKHFNAMAGIAQGSLLLCGNDDMVFRTPAWDARLLTEMTTVPDGIVDINVRTHNARVYPFATIARVATRVLGYCWDPRVQLGDLWWRDVCAHFDRLRALSDVAIDHDWAGHAPDATHREADPSSLYIRRPDYAAEHRAAIADAIAKLTPWVSR